MKVIPLVFWPSTGYQALKDKSANGASEANEANEANETRTKHLTQH